MKRYLALLLVGCTGQSGTDVETPACGDQVGERPIAADEVVDGRTANQLAAAVVGLHETELRFFGSPTRDPSQRRLLDMRTDLTVEADTTRARELRWQTRGYPEQRCAPTIDVPARIRLIAFDRTLEGTFSGSLTGTLDNLTVFASSRRSTVGGTYDSSWYADDPDVVVRMFLRRELDEVALTEVSIALEDDGERVSAQIAELR